jgi:hypothetical protein
MIFDQQTIPCLLLKKLTISFYLDDSYTFGKYCGIQVDPRSPFVTIFLIFQNRINTKIGS